MTSVVQPSVSKLKIAVALSVAGAWIAALDTVFLYQQSEAAVAEFGVIDPPPFLIVFLIMMVVIFTTAFPSLHIAEGLSEEKALRGDAGPRSFWISAIGPAFVAAILGGGLWSLFGFLLGPYGFIKYRAFFCHLPFILFVSVFVSLIIFRGKAGAHPNAG